MKVRHYNWDNSKFTIFYFQLDSQSHLNSAIMNDYEQPEYLSISQNPDRQLSSEYAEKKNKGKSIEYDKKNYWRTKKREIHTARPLERRNKFWTRIKSKKLKQNLL